MKQNVLKKITSFVLAIAGSVISLQFTNCTNNYYLEKCQSTVILPNSIPVPVTDRKTADLRFSLRTLGNTFPQQGFNDGNHIPAGVVYSDSLVTPPFSGNNVLFKIPALQGHLDADFSITKNFFVYGGVKAGIGNEFMGAYHVGGGISFESEGTVLQCYFAYNVYSLKNQAAIHYHTDTSLLFFIWPISGSDASYNVHSNSFSKGNTIGFQVISLDNDVLNSQFAFGFDFQHLNYCDQYAMIMATPHAGITRTKGNSQFTLSIQIGTPIFKGNSIEKWFSGKMFPSVGLGWTFCKRWKKRSMANKPSINKADNHVPAIKPNVKEFHNDADSPIQKDTIKTTELKDGDFVE